MEEAAAVPRSGPNAEALLPHLKRCGYGDARIERGFKVDATTIEVAAFAGRPFDNWSACLAAVNLDGDSKASAAKAQSLGAASVFVCGPEGVDWWGMGPSGPTAPRPISWEEVAAVFKAHKAELAPAAIYDAKLRRPGARSSQMWFLDAGLMPAVERNRGQTLLRLVESAISLLNKQLGAKLNSRRAQEDVYRTVFWQLAAKILHDKGVPNFKQIDLTDVDQVFDRIGKHHGATRRLPPFGASGRDAIDEMATSIAECGSLRDVSSESIAYVYENALLDKAAGAGTDSSYDIRKELGIHSTPSVLIHHMLAQMWTMVEEIDPKDRVVFEPACGHAPFLTAAMRWLRAWDADGRSQTDHADMRGRLRGLEKDPFAIELAKLALTLADEPHGNSWAIQQGDMFASDALTKEAGKARILLANPPYEAFSEADRKRYGRLGCEVTAQTKAVELLSRTIPHLPRGGVFGVVMPVGVLHDRESTPIREQLLRDFDLAEISVFADNLFEHGDHEVAVLMGRKKRPRSRPLTLMYRRVREAGMRDFKERLAFSSERVESQARLEQRADVDLRLRDLEEVWECLDAHPRLETVAVVRQGLSLHAGRQPSIEGRAKKTRPGGAVPAIVSRYRPFGIFELPNQTWIYTDRRDVLHWRGGRYVGHPQVLLNYASQSRGAWRLKAFYDPEGHATTNKYTTIRPTGASPSALALWGLMNSPIANAYAHSASLKRHTLDGLLKSMPVPKACGTGWVGIESAARRYLFVAAAKTKSKSPARGLFEQSGLQTEDLPTDAELREAILAMDAAVLRAYDLPPRLERQLLDLFTGVERKGVGLDGPDGHSTFRGYYPPGFTSALPLHMLLSERFDRAAADKTASRFAPGSSEYVRDVLRTAADATGEA